MKSIRSLVLTFILSAGAVFSIYLSGRTSTATPYGGFTRNLVPSPILSSKAHDLRYNSFYLAGVTDSLIFLGSYTAPRHMLICNYTLDQISHWQISLPDIKKYKGSITIRVDSPYYHVFNGIEPFIYRGLLDSSRAELLSLKDNVFFKTGVAVSEHSYVLKAESALKGEDVIIKRNFKQKSTSVHDNVLEKQIDGLFCTDGMLHYSQEMTSIVYVYYYRNEIIVVDTSFIDIARVHTIDTITKARLKIESYNRDRTKTLAAPPFIVNKRSSIYGDKLFVQSNVRANNEKPLVFKNNPVIDVYDLQDRAYLLSFYIPQYEGIKMNTFRVHKSTIVALHDHYLLVYNLQPQAFSTQREDATID